MNAKEITVLMVQPGKRRSLPVNRSKVGLHSTPSSPAFALRAVCAETQGGIRYVSSVGADLNHLNATSSILPAFHFLPTNISINIIYQKCNETNNHRNIPCITYACHHPQND